MAIEIKRKEKRKMYECQVFFPSDYPKKWKYVTDLERFSLFLSRDHVAWKYFNVYEKGSRKYLKRFYPGTTVPKVLSFIGFLILFSPLPSSKGAFPLHPYPLKNTPNETTSSTSINVFNYCATIPTLSAGGKEVVCTL
jgi:hypothetical protein